MPEVQDPLLVHAERLCETLERIGDALVAIDADTLLDTQETLEQLVSALKAGGEVEDQDALKRTAKRAAAALLRCRRLGGSFSGIAGTRLRLRTGVETYGRTGSYVETAVSGSAVKVLT
jgi:hypothetical protein